MDIRNVTRGVLNTFLETLDKSRETLLAVLGQEVMVGIIHDVFAHANAYVVRLPVGGTRLAAKGGSVSFTPLGAREINQLQIGDAVLCYFPRSLPYGYIVCALPPQVFDARFVLPDALVMRSLVGIVEDQMHSAPFQNEENDLGNFSGGRPADTLEGDWGYINELGVAVWLGKLMAQLRASDVAKIEAFWGDDLVRIFGYNLQRYTAGSEKWSFDDEGEYAEVEHWTPFMWESMGAYAVGESPLNEFEGDSGGLKRGNENSRYEPKNDKQVIVFRGLNMRGYLGDVSKRSVVLPPVGASGMARSDDEKKYRGVFEEHIGIDGAYHLRSSKEVLLEKSLIMPVPRRLLDPDDPSGDKASGDSPNYKPANQYGDGPEQEQKPYRWSDDSRADVRLNELWDYQAYLFGKYGLQVIDAHEKDWEAPEENELQIAEGEQSEIDTALFEPLGFDFSKELPKYGQVAVDQREGHEVRYYKARSCVHMLDDGSVVIEDGYGSQIFMSGGNIHMTCQGDIFQRPGRNFIAWAPHDFVARAGYCAEVTAAKKDVRIKAEENLHVLAGHSGTGALLLESRSSGQTQRGDWSGKVGEEIVGKGIILKAEESSINLWAQFLYGGIYKDGAGRVEINAGTGHAVMSGARVGHEALNEWSVMVGPARSQTSRPPQYVLTPGKAIIRAKTDIVGDLGVWPGSKGSGVVWVGSFLHVKAGIGTEGTVEANGHFIGTNKYVSETASYSFSPSPSGEGARNDAEAESRKESIFGEFDQDAFDSSETSPGNQQLWNAVGFSFRKTEQHKLDDTFKVFESRWQQLYRKLGGQTKWDEPIVESPEGVKTRPHPGQEAWEDEQHYAYTDDGQNVDLRRGVGKDRDQQSEQGQAPEEATLKDEYIVNVQS